MYPDTKELVTALASIMSISGQEERGREKLCALAGSYFDEYLPDPSGTHVFVKRCGREGAPKLLLDAHFDEIGMLVSDITEEGFLRVVSVRRTGPADSSGCGSVDLRKRDAVWGDRRSPSPSAKGGGS